MTTTNRTFICFQHISKTSVSSNKYALGTRNSETIFLLYQLFLFLWNYSGYLYAFLVYLFPLYLSYVPRPSLSSFVGISGARRKLLPALPTDMSPYEVEAEAEHDSNENSPCVVLCCLCTNTFSCHGSTLIIYITQSQYSSSFSTGYIHHNLSAVTCYCFGQIWAFLQALIKYFRSGKMDRYTTHIVEYLTRNFYIIILYNKNVLYKGELLGLVIITKPNKVKI